jgi:hypothetical protein
MFGIALVRQHRTIATALIALGFCSVALSHIASTLVGFYAFSGQGNFADAANRVGQPRSYLTPARVSDLSLAAELY